MNDRKLVTTTDESADLLAELARRLGTVDAHGCTVLDRINDGQNGHPQAASYTGSSRVARVPMPDDWPDKENPDRDNHLPSDPTGEAAIRHDRAAQDRRDLDRAIAAIRKNARDALRVVQRWEARHATDTDSAKVEHDNTPSCQSCARIEGHNGPMWAPVYRHGTCNGNLTEALHLCSWCYTFTRNQGRLPVPRELEQHRDGIPVRTSA